MIAGTSLIAPAEYWTASPIDIERVCNGAGPNGLGSVAFMTVWGLDMTEPCGIHDWMYHYGRTDQDKVIADDTFLHNMFTLIDQADRELPLGMKWLTRARRRMAFRYYWLVANLGKFAFGRGD